METKTKLNWQRCSDVLPPVGVFVMTKIDDAKGPRNEAELKRYQKGPTYASLWFDSGGVYIYYEPTHWAYINYEPTHWAYIK
jgi:hypothetical protein